MKIHTTPSALLLTLSLTFAFPISAVAASCLNGGCHLDLTQLKHLHGPTGAEMAGVQGCIMCHLPSGSPCTSSTAGQFKLKKKAMCQTCHEKGLGSQHSNASTPCLKCHNPHGSDVSPYMLRKKK